MGRRLKEETITTRTARLGLASGLYWRSLDPDVHLGYRKGKRTGSWIVRWRNGTGYRQAPLATADDIFEADGAKVLSYGQATTACRVHVASSRADERMASAGPIPTVKTACQAYSAGIETRQPTLGGKPSKISRSRLQTHVLADMILGGMDLHALKSSHIQDWKTRLREKQLAETTVRRIANDFRAALNAAGVSHRAVLPLEFSTEMQDGFRITNNDPVAESDRPNIILSDDDVRGVIVAAKQIDDECGWDGHLHQLVTGLAATGARYSQIARVAVSDFQPTLNRILIPSSNKGRGNRKRPPIAIRIGDDVISKLASQSRGRHASDLLFKRWAYKRTAGIKWEKEKLRGWLPSELTKPFAAIATRAGLSEDVTAYSLRHSSIVRGLRANLPVRLVAAIHDTSSDMIEKYYSAFIVDALGAAAAAAIIPLI